APTGEAQPGGQLAGGDLLAAQDRERADLGDRVDDAQPGDRLQLAQILTQVGQPDRLAGLQLPAVERDPAHQGTQQRGLPGAVDPHDTKPVAGPDPPGHPVLQDPVTDLDRRVEQIEHVLAETGRGEADQLDGVSRWWFVGYQGLRGVDPEPRL